MRSLFFNLTITSIALLSISGIGRHDIAQAEYLQLAKQKQFDCVGQVYQDTIPIGSCVLICESMVLSAAHVFIQSETKPDTIVMNGTKIVAFVPYNEHAGEAKDYTVMFKGVRYKIKRLSVHPNYLDTTNYGAFDISLIELEQAVKDIAPAMLNQWHDELDATVTGVGYGAVGVGNKAEEVSLTNEKSAGQNVIDSIGGFVLNGQPTLLYADFDHPTRTECNKLGNAKPTKLEYIIAGGDSGGGLFREHKGKWELIGINSGAQINTDQFSKSAYYGQIMEWTRVSSFKEWIDTEINLSSR